MSFCGYHFLLYRTNQLISCHKTNNVKCQTWHRFCYCGSIFFHILIHRREHRERRENLKNYSLTSSLFISASPRFNNVKCQTWHRFWHRFAWRNCVPSIFPRFFQGLPCIFRRWQFENVTFLYERYSFSRELWIFLRNGTHSRRNGSIPAGMEHILAGMKRVLDRK